jgi:hypothetical protein
MPDVEVLINMTRTTCDVRPLFGLEDLGFFLREFPFEAVMAEPDVTSLFRIAMRMMPLSLQIQDKRWAVEGAHLAKGAAVITYVPVIGSAQLPLQVMAIALVPRS